MRVVTCVWLLAIAALGLTGCASARQRLTSTARDVYREEKVSPDGSSDREITQLIERAATELEEKHASPADVDIADERLRKLVTEIARQSRQRACENDEKVCSGTTRPILGITAEDVKKIKEKLCPLYPFC